MKKLFLISAIITVTAALVSVAAGLLAPLSRPAPPVETEPPVITPTEPPLPPSGWRDFDLTLSVLIDGEACDLPLDEYLFGVVAAEMPASFEQEALTAQAVAARTYALLGYLHPRHENGDVCVDSTHCAAFAREEELREKWGGEFEANAAKIRTAVLSTSGIYMTYDASPILAVFHSSSLGMTESSGEVWDETYPYLVSVATPETADEVPNLVSTVTIAPDDFVATIKAAHPGAFFSQDKTTWLGATILDTAGRVASVEVGGVIIKGTELRKLFDLRSTAIDIEIGENIVFTTSGYGHGVGMSQYGANAMAKNGAAWREILRAYYTGIGFSDDFATA